MTPTDRRLVLVASVAGGLIAVLGIGVMLGWLFRAPTVIQILPGYYGMVFTTALCFALLGTSLLLPRAHNVWRIVGHYMAGGTAISIAVLVLIQFLFDVELGVDLHVIHDWFVDAGFHPGRMAPNTAVAFVLAGAVLILMHHVQAKWVGAVVQVMSYAVIVIGIIGLVGYLLRFELLYGWYQHARMALHTAAGLLVLGIGLVASWAELPWSRTLYAGAEDRKISMVGSVILIVLALASGLGAFAVLQQQTESALKNWLSLSLANHVDSFEEAVRQNFADMEFIASRPLLMKQLIKLEDRPGDEQIRETIMEGINSFIEFGHTGVAIYDHRDRLVAQLGEFLQRPYADFPLHARHKLTMVWKQGIYLQARIPMVYRGRAVGYMLAERPVPYLERLFVDVRSVGESSDLVVCGPLAEALQCLPLRTIADVSRQPRVIDGAALPISYAVAGKSDVIVARDYRQQNVIAAYSPIGRLGLGMVVKMDTAELYGPIRQRLQYALPLLAALVILGALLLRWQVMPLVRRLVKSEQESTSMRYALENAVEGIARVDKAGRFASVNETCARILRRAAASLIGADWTEIVHPDDHDSLHAAQRIMREHGKAEVEVRSLRSDGSSLHTQLFLVPAFDAQGRSTGHYGFMKDISERKKLEASLHDMSFMDELTELYNRRGFLALADQQLKLARRSNKPLHLFFADMDGMKHINDHYGHAQGDNALAQVARILRQTFRESDVIGRLGGDEFAILAIDTDAAGANIIAARLREKLHQHNAAAHWPYSLELSVGFVNYQSELNPSIEDLMAQADQLMYRNKEQKRRGR